MYASTSSAHVSSYGPTPVRRLSTCLVTGGAGFFGNALMKQLLAQGVSCISVDLQPDTTSDPNLRVVRGDIRDTHLLDRIFSEHAVDTVFHCAAVLAHDAKDKHRLWTVNVSATRTLAKSMVKNSVPKIVFISSNCLWGRSLGRPVMEDDEPCPVEIYGRSKWEAEKVLRQFGNDLKVTILRSPTIVGSGRLGLLGILFEFIHEGRRIPVVGSGDNRYQFVYALDLADACIRVAVNRDNGVYNVGSDHVRPLRDVYNEVIARAGTGASVVSLPRAPTLALMRLASSINLSPLGPYHYRMIAEDFEFDTSRIKATFGWSPTLTNEGMLQQAYEYYERNLPEIRARTDVSAHRRVAQMGAIRLIKHLC